MAKEKPAKRLGGNVAKPEELVKFYRDMLLIRRFEERAGQLYGMGLIGGCGPQVIGLLSDAMAPELGEASLGRAILIVGSVSCVWSALHFWLAGRRLREDFAKRIFIGNKIVDDHVRERLRRAVGR